MTHLCEDPTTSAPLVSVVIPTLNRAAFIGRAIESVLAQTGVRSEIVVVDDGSSDDTAEVVRALQARNGNILFFQNDRRKGPAGARNAGVLRASGGYLAFLDSDDAWLGGHLSKGVAFLEAQRQVDVLFSNFNMVDHATGRRLATFFDEKRVLRRLRSRRVGDEFAILDDNVFMALVEENFFHLGGVILRRSAMKGLFLDEDAWFGEDRDFGIRLYKERSAVFACREMPSFEVTRHDANLSNYGELAVQEKIVKAHIQQMSNYLKRYDLTTSEERLLRNFLARKYRSLAYLNRRLQQHFESVKNLCESLRWQVNVKAVVEFGKTVLSAANLGQKGRPAKR